MKRAVVVRFVLVPLLLSQQLVAQVALDGRQQQIDGKSLTTPQYEQATKDALSTPEGRAGHDEPGVHALEKNRAAPVPDTRTNSRNTPASPDATTGQRP